MALAAAGAEVVTLARMRRAEPFGTVDAVVMDAEMTDSWGRPWSADLRASQGRESTTKLVGIYTERLPAHALSSFDAIVRADRAALELVDVLARLLHERAA
jgi:CBS domain-containing protein